MKILCLCEYGSNRSVHFATILKRVKGDETLVAGTKKNTKSTLKMLYEWADVIVNTDIALSKKIPIEYEHKVKLYNVGKDVYKRPYNEELMNLALKLLEAKPIHG